MAGNKNTISLHDLPEGAIPEGVTADYSNDAVRAALDALLAAPDYNTLSTFLLSLREGFLVVDASGSAQGKKSHRVRTLRSTKGQLILPIFTSMAELRLAVPTAERNTVRGIVLPATNALALIQADKFAAVQFDAGSAQFVVLRKFITRVLQEDDALSPDSLGS
ncbi:SseB family protein [Lysinibacter sp. HNR]|uniref:SseB family protein n=1 Tax=Lysinibacter sp. HNR TaxID=3031408 RepID=UPI002434BA0B|nr:SseB family protein [Lysinibacter sp. HNR]WGD37392.1 SseB family protein [Lysinibacter sp. HNR]